jgi:hypothetical protein
LASYTSASGVTQNPTDIVLDSRGETPNGVWLNGASYKFVLADAAATPVVIWTVDNIEAQEAINDLLAFEALLAGSTGSTLVGFTQNGPGTLRTVQSKLSDSYSVADFGFLPSASAAANTTAFANAWNISRQLTIPAGTYNVTSLPNFAIRGARIQGIGRVVLNITGAGPGLVIDAGATPLASGGVVVQDIVIDNLTIDGVNSASGNVGVFIRGITHSEFNRLRPINWIGSAMYCSFMVNNSFYDFCYSGNEPGISILTATGLSLNLRGAGEECAGCTWINPIIEGATSFGIDIASGVNNTFVGGTVEGNGYIVTGSGGAINLSSGAGQNIFISTFLEANGILGDATTFHIKDAGIRNSFYNILADATLSPWIILLSGSNSALFSGGQIANLRIDAGVINTVTTAVAYTGTITNNGTDTRHIQLFNVGIATTLPDSYITKGTWTPVATSLAIVGTPTYVGTFERIGDFVNFTIFITSTTSTAATAGLTTFSTPTPTIVAGTCAAASNTSTLGLGTGLVNNNLIYVPTWGASVAIVVTGQYFAA